MTVTHRMSDTPTYSSWQKMRQRCNLRSCIQWKWYGGKGIRVCDRWQNSFPNFLADMGPRPDGNTIDRIDSDGDYSPENCRWADQKTQVRGQRKTIRFEGVPLIEICERDGLNFPAIYQRIKKGMPIEKAIHHKSRIKKTPDRLAEYIKLKQARITNKKIAEHFGMSESGIEKWLKSAHATPASLWIGVL